MLGLPRNESWINKTGHSRNAAVTQDNMQLNKKGAPKQVNTLLLSDKSAATMELKETHTALIEGKLSEEATESGRKKILSPALQNNGVDTEFCNSKEELAK